MRSQFLGRVDFSRALEVQEKLWQEALASSFSGCVLGFESEPVITLGVRGRAESDFIFSAREIERRGFQIANLDRGGQATLHNPGQLVIFPVWNVREIGARRWIQLLAEVTEKTLLAFGVAARWNPNCPGVYTERGKIMSCGVRIRRGVSTHGIAINVCNDLRDFSLIRACGMSGAAVDRMGEGFAVEEVFRKWGENFHLESVVVGGSPQSCVPHMLM